VKIVVAHLYPDYLNIYADRGNMAVLDRRAAWRGIGFDYRTVSVGETPTPGEADLYYVGGGQDREQALIAPDLAAKGPALAEAVAGGAALLAVCGGYQLLGRVAAGFGNNGEDGLEGCRVGRAIGTYLHGPLLPRNPWLADWLIAEALARRAGEPVELEPIAEEFEAHAHRVAAERARTRGGRL
jgi:CobQ-like glutamine amidotransferase family enzyme